MRTAAVLVRRSGLGNTARRLGRAQGTFANEGWPRSVRKATRLDPQPRRSLLGHKRLETEGPDHLPKRSISALSSSIGSGKTMVEFLSAAMVVSVCR